MQPLLPTPSLVVTPDWGHKKQALLAAPFPITVRVPLACAGREELID